MANLRKKVQSLWLRPCPTENIVDMYLGQAPPSPVSPTASEQNMEQLIFDLHLNSPSKERRQVKCVSDYERKLRESILHPTEEEKIVEQFIFDIYLHSPTRERRLSSWEKQRSLSCPNGSNSPVMHCTLNPRTMSCVPADLFSLKRNDQPICAALQTPICRRRNSCLPLKYNS